MTDQNKINERATNYHETVDDLRRELIRPYVAYQRIYEENQNVPGLLRQAALSASTYAYIVAGILKFAADEFGEETSRALAHQVDELLQNGDDLDLNADVMPEPRRTGGTDG